MSILKTDDISIAITSIFMKYVGLWMAKNRCEHYLRKVTVVYSLIAILFAAYIQATDLYYQRDDFAACLYITCNFLSVMMPLFKLLVLLAHKQDFFQLIIYMQKKFLHGDYDDNEKNIVIACKQQCAFFICFFTLFTKATIASYIISPLIANIGKNESDRVLPFKMWLNIPLSMTPYHEIMFVAQVFSMYHVAVGYFCFDNFLCILNLHLASQFRILRYRMSTLTELIANERKEKNEKLNMDSYYFASKCYTTLKNYIRQHQTLIAYCEKMEEVFSMFILGQVLMFSMLICLDGFQVTQPGAPLNKRVIFTWHLSACLCQLLMFTYSCHCVMEDSEKVAIGAYSVQWTTLPIEKIGMMFRNDLIMIIGRSRRVCCLTANGFFPVSLETYTTILSTAVSYFTLLRNQTDENET